MFVMTMSGIQDTRQADIHGIFRRGIQGSHADHFEIYSQQETQAAPPHALGGLYRGIDCAHTRF